MNILKPFAWSVVILLILSGCSEDKDEPNPESTVAEETSVSNENSEEDQTEIETTTTEPKLEENNEQVEDKTEQVDANTEKVEDNTATEKAEEESESTESTNEDTTEELQGVELYMPERQMKKIFKSDEFEIIREVEAIEGNLVLEKVTFGDVEVVQVSEWTESTMKLLFNGPNESDKITLGNYPKSAAPEVLVDKSANSSANWKIKEEGLTLDMQGQQYKDVLLIEQSITSETSDQVTITRYALGKGLGIIKEEQIVRSGKTEKQYITELVEVQ